ncbi:ATP-binding protein [Actinospica robiniae]|uniref:ATP-binding protein n=1 Tax=Actinospica robiniae TaxID=304901 RepID=UPI00146FACCD|nr:ATP-binding protein [Actinospica robiniae]
MGETLHVPAWHMRGDANSIRRARERAHDFLNGLRPRISSEEEQSTLLAVSELVTNAVCHTPGSCALNMTVEDGHVCIAVSDTSRSLPSPRAPEYDGEGGFGLHLLALLAGSLETEVHPHGKTVVARIAVGDTTVRAR